MDALTPKGMVEMEYKTMPSYTKSIDERTVTGYASIFGNVDDYGDIVQRGAFKKTLQEGARRVKHLWMHDAYSPPTAAIKEMREVGADELPDEVKAHTPEATGALLIAREYLDTPRGNEILTGIKAGAISEMSFGFDAIKWETVETEEKSGHTSYVRHLKELRLWDTSDVTWGANPATVASKMYPLLEAYKHEIDGEQYDLIAALVELTQKAVHPEVLKRGEIIQPKNLERYQAALDELDTLLFAAEPPEDIETQMALTQELRERLASHEFVSTVIGV